MFWKVAKRLRSKIVSLLLLHQKINSRMPTNSMLEMLVIEFINDTEKLFVLTIQQHSKYGKKKHEVFCMTHMLPTDKVLKVIFPSAPI